MSENTVKISLEDLQTRRPEPGFITLSFDPVWNFTVGGEESAAIGELKDKLEAEGKFEGFVQVGLSTRDIKHLTYVSTYIDELGDKMKALNQAYANCCLLLGLFIREKEIVDTFFLNNLKVAMGIGEEEMAIFHSFIKHSLFEHQFLHRNTQKKVELSEEQQEDLFSEFAIKDYKQFRGLEVLRKNKRPSLENLATGFVKDSLRNNLTKVEKELSKLSTADLRKIIEEKGSTYNRLKKYHIPRKVNKFINKTGGLRVANQLFGRSLKGQLLRASVLNGVKFSALSGFLLSFNPISLVFGILFMAVEFAIDYYQKIPEELEKLFDENEKTKAKLGEAEKFLQQIFVANQILENNLMGLCLDIGLMVKEDIRNHGKKVLEYVKNDPGELIAPGSIENVTSYFTDLEKELSHLYQAYKSLSKPLIQDFDREKFEYSTWNKGNLFGELGIHLFDTIKVRDTSLFHYAIYRSYLFIAGLLAYNEKPIQEITVNVDELGDYTENWFKDESLTKSNWFPVFCVSRKVSGVNISMRISDEEKFSDMSGPFVKQRTKFLLSINPLLREQGYPFMDCLIHGKNIYDYRESSFIDFLNKFYKIFSGKTKGRVKENYISHLFQLPTHVDKESDISGFKQESQLLQDLVVQDSYVFKLELKKKKKNLAILSYLYFNLNRATKHAKKLFRSSNTLDYYLEYRYEKKEVSRLINQTIKAGFESEIQYTIRETFPHYFLQIEKEYFQDGKDKQAFASEIDYDEFLPRLEYFT